MKTKAAIAWKASAPLSIEEVELLQGPKAGEVLVEIKATGVCHTDYYTLRCGPEGIFHPSSVTKAQAWSSKPELA